MSTSIGSIQKAVGVRKLPHCSSLSSLGTFHVQPFRKYRSNSWNENTIEGDPHHGNHVWPLDENLSPQIQLMEETKRRGCTTNSTIYFVFIILLEISKFFIFRYQLI
jgi:hypothetical protein